jgi:hypothetical protein
MSLYPLKILAPAALAALTVTLTGCGSGIADEAAPDKAGAGAGATDAAAAAPVAARAPNTAGTDGADDRPRRVMTESDRLWMQTAEGACQTDDFGTFLRAYGGSWAVREKYTAATVQYGTRGRSRAMPRQQYLDQNNFPITPVDYYWGTADSYRNFEANGNDPSKLVYVQIEFNTAADNRRSVEWIPGIFQKDLNPPPPELEEGLGDLVQQTGNGGQLLFYPTATCWELAQDISNPPFSD